MRITVTLKDVVGIILILLFIFILYRIFKDKEPMTNEEFIQSLANEGYGIVDMQTISGDWAFILENYYNNNIPIIMDYDMGLAVQSHYIAKKASTQSEITYKTYNDDEDAKRSFTRYKDSRQVSTNGGINGLYNQFASHENVRTGKNYEMYYIKDLKDDYFLVSRIDNTLLISYIENDEKDNLDKVFNKLGYGIHSY